MGTSKPNVLEKKVSQSAGSKASLALVAWMVGEELYVRHPSGPNPRDQPLPPRSARNCMCAAPTDSPGLNRTRSAQSV